MDMKKVKAIRCSGRRNELKIKVDRVDGENDVLLVFSAIFYVVLCWAFQKKWEC